jgi:hypothetical protein
VTAISHTDCHLLSRRIDFQNLGFRLQLLCRGLEHTCVQIQLYLNKVYQVNTYSRDSKLPRVSSYVPSPKVLSVQHKPEEPGQHSRYSDWLRAGRQWGWSPSPGRVMNFLFSTSSRPALGPTQPPIQWVPVATSRGKTAGAWSSPLTSSLCRRQENVVLHIHSPIHLHGVALN